jgi:hypothetical protein
LQSADQIKASASLGGSARETIAQAIDFEWFLGLEAATAGPSAPRRAGGVDASPPDSR